MHARWTQRIYVAPANILVRSLVCPQSPSLTLVARPESIRVPTLGEAMQPRLRGRQRECEVIDDLLATVRTGESRVLVLHGEPGTGKSALLDHLASRATGFRVARAAGVESEMELAYAGLHQLCAPFAERIGRLPAPQRDALGIAFGLRSGDAPSRFLSAWPSSASSPKRRRRVRSSWSSTTPSGSTRPRPRRPRSSPAGSLPSRWRWWSRCATPSAGTTTRAPTS